MLLLPILAGVFAGVAIGITWASHQGRRRRFNAIVEGTERDGVVLYRGVYYEVPDDDRPLPEEDDSAL